MKERIEIGFACFSNVFTKNTVGKLCDAEKTGKIQKKNKKRGKSNNPIQSRPTYSLNFPPPSRLHHPAASSYGSGALSTSFATVGAPHGERRHLV